MNFESLVEEIITSLCAAWNNRAFSVIEQDYLTEEVVVHSPNILMVYPQAKKPTIMGKKEVIAYWNELLKLKDFNIEIVEFLNKSRQAAAICYYPETNERVKIEINLNQNGKVESMRVSK